MVLIYYVMCSRSLYLGVEVGDLAVVVVVGGVVAVDVTGGLQIGFFKTFVSLVSCVCLTITQLCAAGTVD